MVEIVRKLVRPFIAVSVCAAIIYLAIVGKLDVKELLTIFSMIVGFYFGERAVKNGAKPPDAT